MAGAFDDANTQFFEVDTAPSISLPFTIWALVKSDDATVDQTVLFAGNKDVADRFFYLALAGAVGGDPVVAGAVGTANRAALTSTGYTAGTWHSVAGIYRANNDRSAYIDGGSRGNNTQTATVSGVDRSSIGRLGDSTPSNYMSGDIAEVAIWNADIGDAALVSLDARISPLFIRPDALVDYWIIMSASSPIADLVGGLNMTASASAPTNARHPRIAYPAPPTMPLLPPGSGLMPPFLAEGQQQPMFGPPEVVAY